MARSVGAIMHGAENVVRHLESMDHGRRVSAEHPAGMQEPSVRIVRMVRSRIEAVSNVLHRAYIPLKGDASSPFANRRRSKTSSAWPRGLATAPVPPPDRGELIDCWQSRPEASPSQFHRLPPVPSQGLKPAGVRVRSYQPYCWMGEGEPAPFKPKTDRAGDVRWGCMHNSAGG